uniref:LAGLIDADG homing endonuclease n=1 Tax=Porodaedalea pini TaxID=108901 RepID=A0A5B9RJN2_9AGAM|nr:LAGLIDADG homing endonuclease [Porodaedalea pini]QEG56975.1 LAGLIDADG homing endonuclease [Porodaedalea pini]
MRKIPSVKASALRGAVNRILRDYTWRISLNWLRYSPSFYTKDIQLKSSFIKSNKFINIKLKQNIQIFLTGKRSLSNNLKAGRAKLLREDKDKGKQINPLWVTGFTDAEGCFSIIIEIRTPLKWKVRTSFEINLHEKDIDILYKIQSFFSVGSIYTRPSKKIVVYRVSNVTELNEVIIPHFSKYPLISNKNIDFFLWSKVIKLVLNKEHLKWPGFLTVLSFYASINRGVSKKVLTHFPDIKPFDRPVFKLPDNLDPHWVSGFVGGDGGFSVYVKEANPSFISPCDSDLLRERMSQGKKRLSYRFYITQHCKDLDLMYLFCKFFNCGVVNVRSNSATPRCDFIVQDANSLLTKIIPHFDSYPMLNLKQKDFLCFKESMALIKLNQHLTKQGLEQIKNLSLEMNSNRLKSN